MGERDRARHELLLQLAPLLPDDVVWQARRWFAAGQWSHAARLIAQVFADRNEPLPPQSREVLLDGVDPATAELVALLEDGVDMSLLLWEFVPAVDEFSAECAEIVRRYLESQPGEHTAWQALRRTEGGATYAARLVHLVETQAGPEPHLLAAEIADRLWDAGLASPQVEVFRPESPLDFYYHAAALVEGREIHSAGPAPTIELAVFDEENEEREPEGPDRDAQVAYLNSGEPLTEEDQLVPDLLVEDEEPVVPITLRTDGTWIWSDLSTYYLANHGVALPPSLRAHIAAVGPSARIPTRREWTAMVALENAGSA